MHCCSCGTQRQRILVALAVVVESPGVALNGRPRRCTRLSDHVRLRMSLGEEDERGGVFRPAPLNHSLVNSLGCFAAANWLLAFAMPHAIWSGNSAWILSMWVSQVITVLEQSGKCF